MRRRRLLEMGAALATLPLAGCGAQPGDAPRPAAPSATPAPGAPPGNLGGTAARPPEPPTTAETASAAPPAPPAPAPASTPPTFTRVIAKVGRNHGHVFAVSFADVKAGVAKTYDLTGASGHPHAVTLSAEDMKSLLDGQIVRMQSTRVGGHAHRLFVRCAPPVDPPEWVSACDIEVGGKDEHEMVIPAADMAAKVEKTYDIQGVAGHAHAVKVTAADFQKLANGEPLTLTSSTSSIPEPHAHLVFVTYKPPKQG